MKLGLITIGQSPRRDFTDDVSDLFPGGIEIIQRGALDGFSKADLSSIAAEQGDSILVSLMRDGTQATFAEKHILPLLQKAIDELEDNGCRVILLLCTGRFPFFRHKSLLIKPQEILLPMINRMGGDGKLGIIVPEEEQIALFRSWWDLPEEQIKMVCASPYGKPEDLIQAAEKLKQQKVDMIYLDCMGYTRSMKQQVSEISDCPVILPRTLIVRILGEFLDN